MERTPKGIYTPEYRAEAVKLVETTGISVARAAKQLSMPKSSLDNWVRAAREGKLADVGKALRPPSEMELELARTRKELRQGYGFPRDPGRRFGVPAVYSTEDSILSPDGVDHCSISGHPSHLNCGGLGSATHVTATAGLLAVSIVLKRLAWPEGPPARSPARSTMPRSPTPGRFHANEETP